MATPILTDGLIELKLAAERGRMSRNGWGYSGWSLRASTALETMTTDGWVRIGIIERERKTSEVPQRYRVWMHLDTGEVRSEAEPVPKDERPSCC